MDKAIGCLESRDKRHFRRLIFYLVRFKEYNLPFPNLLDMQDDFYSNVSKSFFDSSKNRRQRLAEANSQPKPVTAVTTFYRRNSDVVAEALARAQGVCEKCAQPAPFRRASDGTPYLEVHYKIPFAAGGDDSVSNIVAVCPNCHRELHYGG